jgi:hypothetical protein
MVSAMPRSRGRVAAAATLLLGSALGPPAADPLHAQGSAPAPAKALVDYPLTPDVLARMRQVMLILDAQHASTPKAVRMDTALIAVIALSSPYGGLANLDRMAQEPPAGGEQDELAPTVQQAGFTSREYVRTWLALITAHLHVAAKLGGRIVDTGATPENIAFVEQHWADVDGFMTEVAKRMEGLRLSR